MSDVSSTSGASGDSGFRVVTEAMQAAISELGSVISGFGSAAESLASSVLSGSEFAQIGQSAAAGNAQLTSNRTSAISSWVQKLDQFGQLLSHVLQGYQSMDSAVAQGFGGSGGTTNTTQASATTTGSTASSTATTTASNSTSSPPKTRPAGNVNTWVDQAKTLLEQNGVPASQINTADIKTIIAHESSGNPNAINLWDSNARAGHPSKGLMQTIPSTFDQYSLPGHKDIWNPVDNIAAGVRYSLHRYGSLSNVPGVRAVHAGHKYRGY